MDQNAIEHPNEQNEDDLNIVDGGSKLTLVDREDISGGMESQAENNQEPSTSHSSVVDLTHTAQNVRDGKAVSQGILSNLPVSPERKKTKRKPTQPKKDPSQPIILILDSLGQTRSGTVRALKDWLAAEGEAKRGIEATIKEKGYYPKASQIPMQSNWTDCGVYLLGYVEKFFQNPGEFKNKLLTGEMSAEEDWPELKPGEMRTNMRKIIFDLAREQEAARKEEKKGKKRIKMAKQSPAPLQSEQVSSATSHLGKAEPADPPTTHPEQLGAKTKPLIGHPTPRLASPFELDLNRAQNISRSHTPEETVKVSSSASIPISPGNLITSPRPKQTSRRTSPEVRIPATTPQSGESMRNREMNPINTAYESNSNMNLSGSASHPRSPTESLKRGGDKGQLRMIAKRQSMRSPSQPSPSVSHNREGSEGQPITIDDSQEMGLAATGLPDSQQSSLADQCDTSTRSLRHPPMLRHSPSVQEIPPPFPRAAKRKQRAPKTYSPRNSRVHAEEAADKLVDMKSDDGGAMDVDESL